MHTARTLDAAAQAAAAAIAARPDPSEAVAALRTYVPWPFPKRVGTVGQFVANLKRLQTLS